MIAAGLVLASYGGLYQLYACNLLLIGLLGASGMFSPMMAYVTSWFDRRRGSAIALVSSGQYVAGAVWPLLLQIGIDEFGWRRTMRIYAVVIAVTIPTLAGVFFRRPPELLAPAGVVGALVLDHWRGGVHSGGGNSAGSGAGHAGGRDLLLLRDDVDSAGA